MVVSFLGGYFRKVCLFDFKRLCVLSVPCFGGHIYFVSAGYFSFDFRGPCLRVCADQVRLDRDFCLYGTVRARA